MIPAKNADTHAFRWWDAARPHPERPGSRAAFARLRRCATVGEAMGEVSALLLFQAVSATSPQDLPDVALAAAVLAHVREDRSGITTARLAGPDSIKTPETALLKPLRFRRLMEAETHEERLAAFRRLAALAGGKLPVRDLSLALLDWTDRRRTRWVFEYWNALPPAGPTPAAAAPNATPKDATP